MMIPFLFVLLIFAGPPSAHAASPEKNLEVSVRNLLPKLEQAAKRRPHKIKAFNDSLAKTHEAALEVLAPASQESAWSSIHQARVLNSGNSFTWLFEAMLQDSQGHFDESHEAFRAFLKKSGTLGDFEKPFIDKKTLNVLRRQVYELLKYRRLEAEEPAPVFVAKGRRGKWNMFGDMTKFSKSDQNANWIFVGGLLLGGAAILFLSLGGVEWYRPGLRSIMGFYVALWIAYLLWLVDLSVGLPDPWTRQKAVPYFLASAAAFFIVWEIAGWIREQMRPIEKGYRRCPQCREVILELSLQCPQCGRTFN